MEQKDNLELKKFNHVRKGIIEGYVIDETEDWITIQFSKDQTIKYSNNNEYVGEGDSITVRRSLLTEIKNDDTEENTTKKD